jgi:DNA-binding NtrC family response regulator
VQAFLKEFSARNDAPSQAFVGAEMLERHTGPAMSASWKRDRTGDDRAKTAPSSLRTCRPERRETMRRRPGLTAGTTVDEAERRLIEVTLEHTSGNKTRAAEMLGISLKTLHNKLNRMKEEG